MNNPTTPATPFACDNCGHKPNAQEVLDHHGDCAKCGDTLRAFTVDAAESIADLTARLATAMAEVERSHREFDAMQIVAKDAMKERDAQQAARRDEESWWKEKHDYQARAEKAESDLAKATSALATATAQLKEAEAKLWHEQDLIDKLLHDASYEGGVRYWISKHDAGMLRELEVRSALAAATARCGELEAKTLKWHKGPALGGEGTAGKNDEGVPQWYDGDRLLIIVEMTSGDEMAIVDIIADEDLFQVKDATTGDTYDAWEPAQWSWWAKFNKHNLPGVAARPDAENANDRFERLAAQFYEETGMMAPGKDDHSGSYTREARCAAWDKWLAARPDAPLPSGGEKPNLP